jgi:hypothetical protein
VGREPYAAVFDGAMPKAVSIERLDTYQSWLLIRKRVLRRVRYQFNDDKTQALAKPSPIVASHVASLRGGVILERE